jgi:hypothetical protein
MSQKPHHRRVVILNGLGESGFTSQAEDTSDGPGQTNKYPLKTLWHDRKYEPGHIGAKH